MDAEPAVELHLTLTRSPWCATRDTLAKHSASPWSTVCQIISLSPPPKLYKLGPDKTVRQVFELKHGKAERTWQTDRTSISEWTAEEFKRLVDTCANE
ncbi:hypothetical protein DFH06DRAFT_1393081 [Mycena polygramma]|nr:hypothetical protein DFH06DRAFT_1393081 [Mycena polygramma]